MLSETKTNESRGNARFHSQSSRTDRPVEHSVNYDGKKMGDEAVLARKVDQRCCKRSNSPITEVEVG